MTHLGRIPEFDDRSRAFNIRALIEGQAPRSYTWPLDIVLDQGREGACVGFSLAHELRAVPLKVPDVDDALATRVYRRARQLDPWPGENYAGTSVLAGVKAVQELGWWSEYRWSFDTTGMDLAVAVSRTGPAVVGINWHRAMYSPTYDARTARWWVRPSGARVGGHAILVRGYNVGLDAFALHNSWGPSWGKTGVAWITRTDLAALLAAQGEAVIPIKRDA